MKALWSEEDFSGRLNGPGAVTSVDDFCERYFSPSSEEWVVELRRRVAWFVERTIGPRVLDAGCGSGVLAVCLAKKPEVEAVVALDLCQRALDATRANLRYLTKAEEQKVGIRLAWAEHLPYCAGYFNTVILGEVLEHVLDDTAAVAEAHRVLRANGRLLVSVPLTRALDQDHIRLFTPFVLSRLLAPHFIVQEEVRIRNWWVVSALRPSEGA